ncbi:MAG TPA: nuclear transport factor 2 family protein, partial [Fibrobacteria bacterium]|nr:nuclear transport factor 2 family protein [Fibrobacteria bacterium]
RMAYETRSATSLDRLLAPDYLFEANPGEITDGSATSWGKEAELDRHRRMFQAISDVSMEVMPDARPRAEPATAETTWTLPRLRMTMSISGDPVEVMGQAEFRLRTVRDSAGSPTYLLVRWIDRN